MAKFTITNTRSADEAIEVVVGRDGIARYNAGAETGPYPVKTKFNDIAVPLPRTNLKVVLAPAGEFEVETTDLVEVEFFRVLSGAIDGLTVVETPANAETTTETTNGTTTEPSAEPSAEPNAETGNG